MLKIANSISKLKTKAEKKNGEREYIWGGGVWVA